MTRSGKILTELKESDFYRNILGLFSGVFAARLIPALFALLIARLYAPGDFGDFVLFLSIASLISVFANGGYEGALLLARDHPEKKTLFSLALRTNLLLNLLLLSGILLFLLFSHRAPHYGWLLLMVPFNAFFFGAIQLIRNTFISNQRFRKLARLELFRALASGILQSLLFIFPYTGLFLGVTLAQALTFAVFLFDMSESPGKHPRKTFFSSRTTLRAIWQSVQTRKLLPYTTDEKALARRYAHFPRFQVPADFFNFLSNQLPVFMIKPFFGPTFLGLYSFSHRYLSIPVQLTSISIGSVYVQKARALSEHPEELAHLTRDLFKKQVWLGLIPFTILAFWGTKIFSLLFGTEWAYAGSLAALLSPWLFFVFTGSPLSTILIAREKQKVSMIFNILLLLSRAGVLLAGGLILKELTPTIALYSLTGFLFFGFLTFYALRLAGVRLSWAFLFLAKAAAIVVVPFLILRLWLGS